MRDDERLRTTHVDSATSRSVPARRAPASRATRWAQVEVPAEHYWGAQTQRSLIHFSIGDDRMPKARLPRLRIRQEGGGARSTPRPAASTGRREAIVKAADEVIAGKLDAEFPLYVWQTGSGTQSNMNVNEVIVEPCQPAAGRRARDERSRSTPTTTSIWGNRPTTRSRRRCTSRLCSRSTEHLLPRLEELTRRD